MCSSDLIDPSSVKYTITLPVISVLDELRTWQVEKAKLDVAAMYKEKLEISTRWILVNLLDMTDDQVDEILADLEDDESFDNRIKQKKMEFMPSFDKREEVEEGISSRDVKILKHRMQKQIAILQEFVEWEQDGKLRKQAQKKAVKQ